MRKVIAQIYEEDDYSVFKSLPENRDLYENRLGKLIASISARYILNPITCNEQMQIIDGEGRFNALKKLGRPIHYYIAEGATKDDCTRMNKYNTKWSILDFATSYKKAGNENYIRLLNTCAKLKLNIRSVLRLANKGTAGDSPCEMSPFERGDLVFTEADSIKAQNIKSLCDEIMEALQFTSTVNQQTRDAIKVVVETVGYNHNRMLRNCSQERTTYCQMSKMANALAEFERIYNKHVSAKGKIYFTDYLRNRGSNVRDYSKTTSEYSRENVSTLK